MSSSVSCEFDAHFVTLLMIIDHLNLVESIDYIVFVENLLFCADVRNLDKVLGDIVINGLCWMSHKYLPFETCLFQKVRDACTMVYVKMSK